MKISIEDRRIKTRRVLVAPPAGPSPDVLWSCDFTKPLAAYAFIVQEKVPGRASIVTAINGLKSLRLHTEPGDNNVAGSGSMERCDAYLANPGTLTPVVFGEGVEQWLHHEVMFPNDFMQPTWQRYVIMDLHHTGSTGQANFMLGFERGGKDTDIGNFGFVGFGGAQDQGRYGAVITSKPVERSRWYRFDYHVRWASDASGFFDAWVDGKRVLSNKGPTLYAGQGVYLKLACYSTPVCDPSPACIGGPLHKPTSVLHGNIVLGVTKQSVTSLQLERVT